MIRAGFWLALAFIGQAAALHLIDAGPLIHYQHYRLPVTAFADPTLRWAILVVTVQFALVATAIFRRRKMIAGTLRSISTPWRLIGAAAMSLCVAAAVSRDQVFFVRELCFAAFIQLVNIANILLFAAYFPAAGLLTFAGWAETSLGGKSTLGGEWKRPVAIDRFAIIAAVWVTLVSAGLAWFAYDHHPHVADEVVYLYSARYFAAGELVMPPPPLKEAFDVDLMDYQPDKWFAAVPFGWPAILSAGERVKASWLVNPLLAGLNVLLIYILLWRLYSIRISRVSVLLLCASPWYIFLGMSYMTHMVTLTCMLIAFLGVARAIRTGSAWPAGIGGLGAGAASLIRPLDGAIVAVLAGLWALTAKGWRPKIFALAAFGIGIILTGSLTLPYNQLLTGHASESPLNAYADRMYGPKANAYGFGPERGLGWATDPYPGHSPFEAVILAELNGNSINTDLFGWSTGSLCLIAIFIFCGRVRGADALMIAAIAGVILAYAPYWGNGGPDFGARYWFLILVPCLALSARGWEWLEGRVKPRATLAVGALAAMALTIYFPWRAVDKYHNYLRMRADVRELAEQYHFGRSLVLVRGERFPDYMSAAIYNPLDLHADAPIYAWDRNAEVHDKILSLYPDRPVWVLEGPTITHGGYRIAAGPLRAVAPR